MSDEKKEREKPERDAYNADGLPDPHSCGMSIEVHAFALVVALQQYGYSAGCTESYRALVELVDYFRRAHGHADYTPQRLIDRALEENAAGKPFTETPLADPMVEKVAQSLQKKRATKEVFFMAPEPKQKM